MNPLVSVVISTYNRAQILPEAIESVLAQTYDCWELLIVDDGSTDSTQEVLARYYQQDSRIRALVQPNAGSGAARNTALQGARGELVAFLDDDDRWLPDKLRRQVERFAQNPSLGLVYTKCLVEKDGTIVEVWPPSRMPKTVRELYLGNFIPNLTVMIRKACLDAVGNFDATMRVSIDYDLWLRIAYQYPFEGIPEPLAIYRLPQPGARNISLDTVSRLNNHIQLLQKITADSRLGLTRSRRVQRIAQVHMALANLYREQGAHSRAALQYIRMVAKWPYVGLLFRDPETTRWRFTAPYRLLKPYLMVGYFSLKALRQGLTR